MISSNWKDLYFWVVNQSIFADSKEAVANGEASTGLYLNINDIHTRHSFQWSLGAKSQFDRLGLTQEGGPA